MPTDERWERIEPFTPCSTVRTGQPMADRRRMFEAAVFMPHAPCHLSVMARTPAGRMNTRVGNFVTRNRYDALAQAGGSFRW